MRHICRIGKAISIGIQHFKIGHLPQLAHVLHAIAVGVDKAGCCVTGVVNKEGMAGAKGTCGVQIDGERRCARDHDIIRGVRFAICPKADDHLCKTRNRIRNEPTIGIGAYLRPAGQSLGCVIDTPRLDTQRPLQAQLSDVDAGLAAADRLRSWWNGSGESVTEMVQKAAA